ncbi:MAG: hypothetical protein HC811_02075 [Flammeovirgaceae bacterium]|nr:hypothetical protein [Flammeovirgaceae bacterium]
MKTTLQFIFSLILVVVLITACDTASSIEDPNTNYFVKYIGGDGDQEGVDMIVNADGTTYLFGNTKSSSTNAKQQLYLVLVDEFGQVIWERTYGDPNLNYEARDIEATNDGRLVFVGNQETGPGNKDIIIMTLDLNGVKLDSTGFDLNAGGMDEVANTVSQTLDGFIVSGYTKDVNSKPSGATNSS